MNSCGNNRIFNSPEASCSSDTIPILACDSCDRSFPTKYAFSKHMSEHRVCGIDGCTLSAHEKILEKHIQMQHSSGIYDRMKELNSPENIAKWIEQRKSKFPSKENIKKRHEQQEELWKKGIRIGERKHKFGGNKRRFTEKNLPTSRRKKETHFKKKEQIKKFLPKFLIDEKLDWNNGLPHFKGMKELFESEMVETFRISDDEDDIREPTKIEDLIQSNSSLGALMGYGTDYSENTDDEGPLEVKFHKTTVATDIEKSEDLNNTNKKRRLKKTNRSVEKKVEQNKSHVSKKSKNSYLKLILDTDIRRERNIILQCVRYTIQNNFFSKTS